MSYSTHDGYGKCKNCFNQKQYCTCNQTIEEHSNKSISDKSPHCQSVGDQKQKQLQEGPEQDQGPQIQDQLQGQIQDQDQDQEQKLEGQTQGDQQQDQMQGPQIQAQNEIQIQEQDQDQTEDQDQEQGDQLQAQRHGDQSMENNQSISTPTDINVDGVKMDVKCGDCKPTIVFTEEVFDGRKKKKHRDRGRDKVDRREMKCGKDCDCCVQNLADLLKDVQQFQSTITVPADKAIDIYSSTTIGLNNPIIEQVINQVVGCSILRFRDFDQIPVAPNTTVQLCDVAGISATDTAETEPNVYEFLFEKANEIEEHDEDCCKKKKKKACDCPCCASEIGKELECTANYRLLLNVFVKGQSTAISSIYVLNVKDCLAYFLDDLNDPATIYVFSLCAISAFTVVEQNISPTV